MHPRNITRSAHCTKEKLPTPIQTALELQGCCRNYGNTKPQKDSAHLQLEQQPHRGRAAPGGCFPRNSALAQPGWISGCPSSLSFVPAPAMSSSRGAGGSALLTPSTTCAPGRTRGVWSLRDLGCGKCICREFSGFLIKMGGFSFNLACVLFEKCLKIGGLGSANELLKKN